MDEAFERLREAPVLVTGAAGFIGYHLSRRLLDLGCSVVGFDSVNTYYDPALKEARLAALSTSADFTFIRADLADAAAVRATVTTYRPRYVAHLAAQAGVRHSLSHPQDFISSNLVGFFNIIDACKDAGLRHFLYASSSSVYGGNAKQPFSTDDPVDHPLSLYAATKKSNELVAHVYSHLHGMPTTGLRFFTVYGPWGRPDMALFLFTRAILAGEPIRVFNNGEMDRDFTYIDDIVEGVLRTLAHVAEPDSAWSAQSPSPGSSNVPYVVYNIGNHQPVPLMHMIEVLEQALGQKARMDFVPMQPGDVPSTFADVESLAQAIGFRPATPIEVGIPKFVAWYRSFYGV